MALQSGRRRMVALRSVRVRITLAAVLLTTLAVGVAGWLLVRSVEDRQLGELRDEIAATLDDVSRSLAAGTDPAEAVQHSSLMLPVEVRDEEGEVVAAAPALLQDGRTVVARLGQDGTRTRTTLPPTHTTLGTQPASGHDGDGGSDEPAERERGRNIGLTTQTPDEAGDGDDDPERAALLASGDYIYAGQLETLSRSVDTPSGTLTVSAAAPVEQVTRSLDALRGALVVGMPLLVVAVAATAWFVVRRALRPVEVIRAEVDAITGSTMHRRVPEPATGDEIHRLAHTMNAMLDRLDRSAQRQRQFVADASHELRSPVAAIRTGLEVARHKGGRADWLAVADRALADEARLEALLDDMLLLAAHDEQGVATSPPRRPVDLARLVAEEAARPRRVPTTVTNGTASPTNDAKRPSATSDNPTKADNPPVTETIADRSNATGSYPAGGGQRTGTDTIADRPAADRKAISTVGASPDDDAKRPSANGTGQAQSTNPAGTEAIAALANPTGADQADGDNRPGVDPTSTRAADATGADQADGDNRTTAGTTSPSGGAADRPPTDPVVVPGNHDQLARVVANLLDNAARHATTSVHATISRTGDVVCLTVDDDGPGIPPADRARVFERFTRLDDGRSRGQGGSGLGLALVRAVVVAHDGQVRIDDSDLGGARFVVDLPTRS
jgi:signal transduction histidine kinase